MLYETILDGILAVADQLKNRKIIVFGTGRVGKYTYSILSSLHMEVEYFVDNDVSRQGQTLFGAGIKHPDALRHERK